MNYPDGVAVIFTGDAVTVSYGPSIKTVKRGQEQYTPVMEHLRSWENKGVHYGYVAKEEWIESLLNAFEPSRVLESYLGSLGEASKITYENGRVFYDGKELHNTVTERIRALAREGLTIEYLLTFLDSLFQNPSYRSVEQLYGFLEKHKMPITAGGCFKAYKVIKSNFTDCYTGNIDNSVGRTVKMNRNRVEDNPDLTCSAGLHVCAHEYAIGFFYGSGRILVEVEINPRDVVSIPTDYNNAKMRVCQYKVTGVLEDRTDVLSNRIYDGYDARVAFDEDSPDFGDEYDESWVWSEDEEDSYDPYDNWDDDGTYDDIPF